MKPILHEGNRIIINKHSKLERFDIVVLQAPYSSDFLVKRIVGLPGETVEYKDDVLYINNKVKKSRIFINIYPKCPFTSDSLKTFPRTNCLQTARYRMDMY